MEIPMQIIILIITGLGTVVVLIIGSTFKVVFGLIGRNEIKSDNADKEGKEERKEIIVEIKENEKIRRDTDRDLYQQQMDALRDRCRIKGKLDYNAGLHAAHKEVNHAR